MGESYGWAQSVSLSRTKLNVSLHTYVQSIREKATTSYMQ